MAVDLIGEVQMTGYEVQANILDFFTMNVTPSLATATGINVEDELVSMGRREGHISTGNSGNQMSEYLLHVTERAAASLYDTVKCQ